MIDKSNGESELKLLASYASHEGNGAKNRFKMGESLVGTSGVGKTAHSSDRCTEQLRESEFRPGRISSTNVVVLPILFEGEVKAVMELSSVQRSVRLTRRSWIN